MKKIEETAGLLAGQKNDKYDLGYCGCLGCCDFGPNLLVNENLVIGASKENIMEEIAKASEATAPTLEEKEANLNKVLDNLI